ncbi:MAG: hypothetical protein WDW38_003475 [Sanguina aurantia]
MSDQDLATLRTAKIALGEDLITQEDFLLIKKAFLRAQQIKAGLDAGFIKQDDYQQARDSFLHALDFNVSATMTSLLPCNGAVSPSSTHRLLPATSLGTQQAPSSTRPSFSRPPSQFSQQPVPATHQSNPASQLASAGSDTLPLPTQSGSGVAPGPPRPSFGATVPVPTDMPSSRSSRASSTLTAGKSMSGISISDQCVDIYNMIKTKSAYKWVSYKVNEAGNEVIIDQLGARDSMYEDFVSTLPDNLCRYAIFDYAYCNADTKQTVQKLVFIYWAPEVSTTKSKMMYASTRDFFKAYLDGIGADFQATEFSELAESDMRERVHAAITRK